MNVYDFDGTIYQGDSSLDFVKYCFIHKPRCLKRSHTMMKAALLYGGNRIDTRRFKELFFIFLNELSDRELDTLIEDFWEKNTRKIAGWYIEKRRDDDVIISASPQFLLEPIIKKLKIQHLIATSMDSRTGHIKGENCKGEEKVRLFKELFPNQRIEEFYSDSFSDTPLALMAKNSFYVEGNDLKEWPQTKEATEADTLGRLLLKYKGIVFYGIFGVLTTLINVLIYEFCYAYCHIPNVPSNILAWLIAVIFAFITNKIWVFESRSLDKKLVTHELLAFFGARIATGLIDICIMWIAVDCLDWRPTLWKIISNVIVIVLNYIASKLLVFNTAK